MPMMSAEELLKKPTVFERKKAPNKYSKNTIIRSFLDAITELGGKDIRARQISVKTGFSTSYISCRFNQLLRKEDPRLSIRYIREHNRDIGLYTVHVQE